MFITDLSDPVFFGDKVKTALDSGEKGILITKDPGKLYEILKDCNNLENVLVQISITGLGGSTWEPYVPEWKDAILYVPDLIELLGENRVYLRFDPIIPGINQDYAVNILQQAKYNGIKGVTVSVLDLYPHVKERILKAGLDLPQSYFHALDKNYYIKEFTDLAETLGFEVRVCCEQGFSSGIGGCDWPDKLLTEEELKNMKPGCQRGCCGCPKYRQLLSYSDRCKHGCLYCYVKW